MWTLILSNLDTKRALGFIKESICEESRNIAFQRPIATNPCEICKAKDLCGASPFNFALKVAQLDEDGLMALAQDFLALDPNISYGYSDSSRPDSHD